MISFSFYIMFVKIVILKLYIFCSVTGITSTARNLQMMEIDSYSASSQDMYCASFSPNHADGVSGYFAMLAGNGYASYSFELNLTNSGILAQCPVATVGLEYHIHTYWKNSSVSSSAGSTYCGSSYTGGHYDPTFACSASSQNLASCKSLNRTSSVGYTYTCNSTIYEKGDFSEW